MLTLEEITPENYQEAMALSVTEAQQAFVSPVVRSLADAYVWDALPRLAREGEKPVGFLMVYPFEHDGLRVINIVRLLIDREHQGRGLGRELMTSLLGWLATLEPPARRLRISTKPENAGALHLYRAFGFEGEEMYEGEVVLWRDA